MSFSEKGYRSSVVMVEYEEDKTQIHQIDVPPYVRLLSIPDRPAVLEEVLEAIHEVPDGEINARSPYLEVKIQMTEPDTSYKYKIESALQGKSVRLARVVAVMPVQKESGLRAVSYEELRGIRPLDVALDYYKRKYDEQEMPAAMKELLQEVISEAGKE